MTARIIPFRRDPRAFTVFTNAPARAREEDNRPLPPPVTYRSDNLRAPDADTLAALQRDNLARWERNHRPLVEAYYPSRRTWADRAGDVLTNPLYIGGVLTGAFGTVAIAFLMVAMGMGR